MYVVIPMLQDFEKVTRVKIIPRVSDLDVMRFIRLMVETCV